MVPKPKMDTQVRLDSFRAVLFRMVPKLNKIGRQLLEQVLELCCFEWFQNFCALYKHSDIVLELCCFEWFQNAEEHKAEASIVLELCCFEWFQNHLDKSFFENGVLELCCFEWFQNTRLTRV